MPPLHACQWTIFGILLLDVVLLASGPVELGPPSPLAMGVIVGGALVVIAGHCRRLHSPLQKAAEATFECLAASLAVALFSHLWIATPRPDIDPLLEAADRAIGVGWQETVLAFAPLHDTRILPAHYLLVVPLTPILAAILAFHGKTDAADRYRRVFVVALAITGGLWAFAFSQGPAYHRLMTGGSLPAPVLVGEDAYRVAALWRTGELTVVDMFQLQGFIGFPSFHAVMIVLTCYGACQFRGGALVGVPFAVLALIATVTEGGHNVVDIVAGAGLTLGLLALCERQETRAVRPVPAGTDPIPSARLARAAAGGRAS